MHKYKYGKSTMPPIIIIALCILKLSILVQATGLYSVIGPGTIRSNFQYTVAISLHKADGPSKIVVGIFGPSFNKTEEVEVQPLSTTNVQFDVPELVMGEYNLTATGISGIIFENSTRLNYADNKPSIFIQTDKATYKPGDVVKFRAIFLNENLRPADIKNPITIALNDGSQNRIKQLKNIQLNKGVYVGELQLSEQPVLGSWNIEVIMEGGNSESKSFEVAKYVLPKFEVSIETAKNIAIQDGVIKATVRAKYTYGKDVKGKAIVSVQPNYHFYGQQDYLQQEKTIDVDGKGHVEFNFPSEKLRGNYLPPLNILAIVKEALTGNQQNVTATINLHNQRYQISGFDNPSNFQPNTQFQYNVVVKNLDGSPVQDTKNKVKITLEPPYYFSRSTPIPLIRNNSTIPTINPPEDEAMKFEANLNKHGIATFNITLPDSERLYYNVRATYLDTTSYLSSISNFMRDTTPLDLLEIDIKTKKPRLGRNVSVEINSSEQIPYFVYVITARGNIIKSELIDVPDGRKSHIIKFTPTFAMIPKTTIYVHYVFDNNLRFEEKIIDFEKDFENFIEISAPQQVNPSEEVKLTVKTDPDSYVGLLGVDQSVLLLKSGNDLDKDQIFNSLNNYGTSSPWQRGYGRYPGQISGLVTLTNANYHFSNDDFLLELEDNEGEFIRPVALKGNPEFIPDFRIQQQADEIEIQLPKKPAIRKSFQENWIFLNSENTNGTGFTLAKKIPDTITSWVITGFSMNPKTGFALTQNPSKIQVFQPFFLSTNLPYSVKRGEIIAIPVIVFNYMAKTLDTEITMDNSDKEFDFIEATNDVEEKLIDEVKRVKHLIIPSNSGQSISFMIRPKHVGTTTLKITATTPLASDVLHQKLKVEPEGITKFENKAIFINLKDQNQISEQLTVDVPVKAVTESEYTEFSVVGDILGPTIKNLDNLVRMPYGCGEQNMVNFVPNILVLKYLNATNQKLSSVEEKAKKFLEIGYQRELTYKHDDGSYSAFGKSDPKGSTWLTAYVVRSFHQAAIFTDIDPKVIVQGLDFLSGVQNENGKFLEVGKVLDFAHQNDLGLTSFVLLTFFENVEHIPKYQRHIEKAVEYIADEVDKSDNLYSLSISAVALQLAQHPKAGKVLAKLESMAKIENDRKWWSNLKESTEDSIRFHWRSRSNNVEITSYILLALLENERAEVALPIIKWLIAQRNSNGGFASTQDTVLGLQALTKFANKAGAGSGTIDIDYTSVGENENKGSIKVNPENVLVLQTVVLPKSTRQVNFTARGKGSSLVQLSYRYNLEDKDLKPSFNINTTVSYNQPSTQMVVDVCIEYVPLEESSQRIDSNMAVLEVALPSGYTSDSDGFVNIKAVNGVKRIETKNSDSTVIIYFNSLTSGDIKCVPVQAVRSHAVAKQKSSPVSVYDYYDTRRRATDYYNINSSLCDICESDDCGSNCKNN